MTGDRFPCLMGRKAASCGDCLAWGVLSSGRRCGSCSVWRHKHPGESPCVGCGRLPRGAVSVLEDGRPLPWRQLFFDRMQLRRVSRP